MAPGASLYAVKVCSSVSTSCSGVAMLQGMDFAVDPNGDGSTSDHVDVVNMSIGGDYGVAFDDDMSYAVDQATKAGVLTVASAGNGSNKPYIAGTPAAAPSALSVAQTQVPSAVTFPLVVNSPAAIAGTYPNTETVAWAPVGTGFAGDVAYLGRGCPGDTYLADPAGKVALIDRGVCAISLKVDGATKAGATAVLIGLVAPGDAVSFSYGGGDLPMVPTLIIQQSLSTAIKGQLAVPATVNVSVSDAVTFALVGNMVGSSSRGPSMSTNIIKPEIGAPGGSVSAVSGSGTGTEAFSGTSGAAPMVTGAAALLRQAFRGRSPEEIKAVLMNTAETEIYTNSATQPGVLAPITRIGGGELRVDRALGSPAAAWEAVTKNASLSFGFVDASAAVTSLSRTVKIRNYTRSTLYYRIQPTFRYANDQANGAVSVTAPAYVTIPPLGTTSFPVTLRITASMLRPWTMNSGSQGNNPVPLDLLEYDGYINLDNIRTSADDADPLHLAWHVLPRLSDKVTASSTSVRINSVLDGLPAGSTTLKNAGAGAAYIDEYSLVGASPKLPPGIAGANAPVIDLRAVGVQTWPVPAGACSASASFVYTIAVNTWERSTLAIAHNQYFAYLDTDEDGEAEYAVFNGALGDPFGISSAQSVTWVWNLDTDAAGAMFYTDHATNATNTVLTFCGEQIGMNATNFYDPITMDVEAVDNYFTGFATDAILGIQVAPLGERYAGVVGTDWYSFDVNPFSNARLNVVDWGTEGTNPSETGVMLVLDAARGSAHGGAPLGNESLLINVIP